MTPDIFERVSLRRDDKNLITKCWWPNTGSANMEDYQSYFEFFHQELRNIPWKGISSPKFAVKTLEDIMTVVKILFEHQAQPRSYIIQEIRRSFSNHDDVAIIRSMELAVRLWLGPNVQTWGIAVSSEMPRATRIQWADNVSLIDMAEQAFQQSKHEPDKQRSRISPGFTAWKLVYLCTVRIEWTDSLSDHLHFEHGSKILKVYRHKICLLRHWLMATTSSKDQDDNDNKGQELSNRVSTSPTKLEATVETNKIHKTPLIKGTAFRKEGLQIGLPKSNLPLGGSKKDHSKTIGRADRNPLPRDLLEETMRTLDLLFPFTGDEDTRLFLKSEGQSFHQIRTPEGLGLPRALDFSEFKYWRDRLEDIHDLFNSPPRTKRQLWRDRRNKRDFWTLIISISALGLAVFLGVWGLINAMRSNEQAKRSLELAQRSFNLALAQACSRQDVVHGICPELPKRALV